MRSKPLRICFVSQEYPPETGWGGIGTYYHSMARFLVAEGHRVVVLTKATDEEVYRNEEGVHVYRVLPRFDVSRFRGLWRLSRFWRGYRLSVALALRKIVQDYQVDVIETPELHAEPFLYSFFSWRHPPLVVRLHTGTALGLQFNRQPLIPRFRINLLLEKWLVGHAAYLTSPSAALLARSRTILPAPERRSVVIPNPVDTRRFCPGRGPEPLPPTVLFVGRLEWWKGPDILAQAMPAVWRAIPNVRFVFVGQDSTWGDGQRFSEWLRARVPGHDSGVLHFLPPVPHEDMPTTYHSATVVAVPSRWEGFGLVCAEAMACGKPVVATWIGGLEELIEDGVSGSLVEPENPEDLAHRLIWLLQDAKSREQMGQAARRRAEAVFSHRVVVPRMLELYRQVTHA